MCSTRLFPGLIDRFGHAGVAWNSLSLLWKGSEALAQAAQRGGQVTIPGGEVLKERVGA